MGFKDTLSRAAGAAKDATAQAVADYRAPEAVAQRQREAASKAAAKARRKDEKAMDRRLHENDGEYGEVKLDGFTLKVHGKKVDVRRCAIQLITADTESGAGMTLAGAAIGTLLPGGLIATGLGALAGASASTQTVHLVIASPDLKKPWKEIVPGKRVPDATVFVQSVQRQQAALGMA
jgi:hypothetical protein